MKWWPKPSRDLRKKVGTGATSGKPYPEAPGLVTLRKHRDHELVVSNDSHIALAKTDQTGGSREQQTPRRAIWSSFRAGDVAQFAQCCVAHTSLGCHSKPGINQVW